ncbi:MULTISPECIES: pilus assembly protein TadG-related protein [Myxococcus]|uniref:pilus assembly protein TadG-related protein n=1 Tax=Myxococcus TaxID=32 RepID=UPI001143DDC8|nr:MULTISPECIES: pilus assembly protein TadG-related protein [Myxococcus]NOK02509.1 pilus assembly protein [Myxococcus xanthus]
MTHKLLSRGQTLVLFALTLLLLTLLVTLTLSLGSKVKEKMEVQAAADAAAYSQAAQTARVFNEMALMSRAQIGHLVSKAAVNSLIDWSSYYRAQIGATRNAYTIAMLPYIALLPCCIPYSGCSSFCRCAIQGVRDITRSQNALSRYDRTEIAPRWDQLERPAAQRALRLSQAAQQMFVVGQVVQYGRLMLELNNQSAANDIIDSAGAGSRWAGELRVDGVSTTRREVAPFLGAVAWPNLINGHHVYAAMGSRGHSFVANRGIFPTDDMLVTAGIQRRLTTPDTVMIQGDGSTYWARTPLHGTYLGTTDTYSIADDHGLAFVTFARGRSPCPTQTFGIGVAESLLIASDSSDPRDRHRWSPRLGTGDLEPAQTRHNMGTCYGRNRMGCPSVWPMFVDYNGVKVMDKDDNWGQPKNFAVIQRDYTVRGTQADPWNLLFRFRFGGTDSGFDNSGLVLGPAGGGLNISRQTAVSTGLAYYHRREHWREPPNLLNPYWRATLVPATVDSSGAEDFVDELNGAGVGWAAEAYEALRAQGYRGGP